MRHLPLGKHRATDDRRDLWYRDCLNPGELPTPPAQFGQDSVFRPRGWGMLGNDQWGNCAWAGAAHETMVTTLVGGYPTGFTPEGVMADYAAATDFDPNAGPPGYNPTDRGTNVRTMLNYRRRRGIVDVFGTRHRIGAYVKLDECNLEEIWQALYVFQVVGIGLEFPSSAAAQFAGEQPWDVVPGATIEGGHYVSLIAKRENLEVVTWGAIQEMTIPFFEEYCDEAWAFLSPDVLVSGYDINGFSAAQLRRDLGRL
jgi:hypothetical protein